MGRVPAPGEFTEQDGLRIDVLGGSERRVSQVRVSQVKVAKASGTDNGKKE